MTRHLINETFGDDSLNDYIHFMKKKQQKNHIKKNKIYIYSWVYNGTEFVQGETTPQKAKG